MENECEGCVTYRDFEFTNCIDAKIKVCPCRRCLVKAVCVIPCKDYASLRISRSGGQHG